MNMLQFTRDYPDPGKISLKEQCAYAIACYDLYLPPAVHAYYDLGKETFRRIQKIKRLVKEGKLTRDCADYLIFEFMGPESLFGTWWRSVQGNNENRIRSVAQLTLSHPISVMHRGKGGDMDLIDTMTETERRVTFGI